MSLKGDVQELLTARYFFLVLRSVQAEISMLSANRLSVSTRILGGLLPSIS